MNQEKGYYQKSHGKHTEFAGVPYEEQLAMLKEGTQILKAHGITPESFFAPAHTYDANTIKALKLISDIKYVSDGYALQAYRKDGMIFIPSICDGPFVMPFGLYTYVFHPSVMTEAAFVRLEKFLQANSFKVTDVDRAMERIRRNQGISGHLIENSIYAARGFRLMRKTRRKKK